MVTATRRAIGAAPVGASAPTEPEKKIDDVPPTDPAIAPDPPPADEIVPVDTESANYKAGYQNALDGVDPESNDYEAGYAAGLGSMGKTAPPDDEPPTPADPAVAAGKPATVHELKALAPDDNDFVVSQLAAGASLAAAQSAFCRTLNTRLKAETAARLKAEKDLADETKSPAPVRLAGGKQQAAADETDPKAVAAKEWDDDPEVRKGYRSKANYVNVRAAELSGRFRSTK